MSYEMARVAPPTKAQQAAALKAARAAPRTPFDSRTGLAGSGVATNTSARAIGRRGGSSGFGDDGDEYRSYPVKGPHGWYGGNALGAAAGVLSARRNAPRGFNQGAAFAFGGFDPISGLAGAPAGGTASTSRARRGNGGLRGYDDGLGFSLARFKINKKSFTRPLATIKKDIVPILAVGASLIPIPGGSILSRLVGGATTVTKTIVNDAKAVGLTLVHAVQPDGSTAVVATDTNGAIVSKPLPVPLSVVAPTTVLPVNAVQAPAPPAIIAALNTPPSDAGGITSILDYFKAKDTATAAATAAKQAARAAAIASGATPTQADAAAAQAAAVAEAAARANAATGGGGGGGSSGGGGGVLPFPTPTGTTPDSGVGSLLQNPMVLIGAGLVAFLAFRK